MQNQTLTGVKSNSKTPPLPVNPPAINFKFNAFRLRNRNRLQALTELWNVLALIICHLLWHGYNASIFNFYYFLQMKINYYCQSFNRVCIGVIVGLIFTEEKSTDHAALAILFIIELVVEVTHCQRINLNLATLRNIKTPLF